VAVFCAQSGQVAISRATRANREGRIFIGAVFINILINTYLLLKYTLVSEFK